MSSRVLNHTRFLTLRILLTEECNISCVFCHNEGQSGARRYSALSVSDLRMIMRAGHQLQLRQIKFSGGEPTLHPHLLDLVRAAVAADMDTVVISNGMRKDELLRAAALGARISINVPSTVPDTYRRLTGGDFGLLTAVLCGLRDSAAVCAINSYSGLSPDEREIRSMMDFADTYQCDLKLLLPCQITSPTRQENARSAYRRVLEELGCEHRADTHYDSTWVAAGGGTVRLVVPFCPNACKKVSNQYKSLRIATDLSIMPCFVEPERRLELDLSSDKACAASLDQALANTALDCGTRSGLKIGRHRLLDNVGQP